MVDAAQSTTLIPVLVHSFIHTSLCHIPKVPVPKVVQKTVQVPVPVDVPQPIPVPHEVVKTVQRPVLHEVIREVPRFVDRHVHVPMHMHVGQPQVQHVPYEVVRTVDVPVPVEHLVEKVVEIPVRRERLVTEVKNVLVPVEKVVEVPRPYAVQKVVTREQEKVCCRRWLKSTQALKRGVGRAALWTLPHPQPNPLPHPCACAVCVWCRFIAGGLTPRGGRSRGSGQGPPPRNVQETTGPQIQCGPDTYCIGGMQVWKRRNLEWQNLAQQKYLGTRLTNAP